MSTSTRFVGNVAITNTSEEAKFVSGIAEDAKLDIGIDIIIGGLKPAYVKAAPMTVSHAGTFGLC